MRKPPRIAGSKAPPPVREPAKQTTYAGPNPNYRPPLGSTQEGPPFVGGELTVADLLEVSRRMTRDIRQGNAVRVSPSDYQRMRDRLSADASLTGAPVASYMGMPIIEDPNVPPGTAIGIPSRAPPAEVQNRFFSQVFGRNMRGIVGEDSGT